MKGNQFTVWNINILHCPRSNFSLHISPQQHCDYSFVHTVLGCCLSQEADDEDVLKVLFKLCRAGFKWQRLFWISALVRLELSFIFNNTRSSTASVTLQLSSLRLGWDQLDDPLYGPHLTPNIWDTQLSSSSPKFTKYLDYIIICK